VERPAVCHPLHTLDEDYLFIVIDLAELHFDDLTGGGADLASDELGLDGEFAVATVDEYEELHGAWATVVEEGVESGADGAASVENIVHQDDVAAFDIEAQGSGDDDGLGVAGGKVVAIEGDVEDTGIDRSLLDLFDQYGETLGDRNAAALNADEAEVVTAFVLFDDLVCEADEGAVDL